MPGRDAAELVERRDVSLEEGLLALGGIDPVHRPAGVGEAVGEHVAAGLHPGQDHVDLPEVDLGLRAGCMLLGHHHLGRLVTRSREDLGPAYAHVVPHRRIRQLGRAVLLDQPGMDPASGMPLLARSLQIRGEHRVDRGLERPQAWSRTHRSLPWRWLRARQRLAHRAATNVMPSSKCTDRQSLDPVIPPYLGEQFHTHPHPRGPPLGDRAEPQPRAPTDHQSGSRSDRHATTPTIQVGPDQTVTVGSDQPVTATPGEDRCQAAEPERRSQPAPRSSPTRRPRTRAAE